MVISCRGCSRSDGGASSRQYRRRSSVSVVVTLAKAASRASVNRDRWRQENYLVQVLVVLLNHAKLTGFIKNEHGNPAHGIPLFKQPGDGWEPRPADMRAEFEVVAPPRARLVYELRVGTGQRIGDMLKFRWNHFSEDAFDFTQGKTDKPMWFPLTDRLRRH